MQQQSHRLCNSDQSALNMEKKQGEKFEYVSNEYKQFLPIKHMKEANKRLELILMQGSTEKHKLDFVNKKLNELDHTRWMMQRGYDVDWLKRIEFWMAECGKLNSILDEARQFCDQYIFRFSCLFFFVTSMFFVSLVYFSFLDEKQQNIKLPQAE